MKTDLSMTKVEVDIKRSPVSAPWPEEMALYPSANLKDEEELSSINPFSFREFASFNTNKHEIADDDCSDESFYSTCEDSEQRISEADNNITSKNSPSQRHQHLPGSFHAKSSRRRNPTVGSPRSHLEAYDSWLTDGLDFESEFYIASLANERPRNFFERLKLSWRHLRRLIRIVRKVVFKCVIYSVTTFIGVFAVIFDFIRRGYRHGKRRAPRFLHKLTAPQIHSGFWLAYSTVREEIHSAVRAELLKEPGDLLVTGHSLGGSLATLCAVDLSIHTVTRLNKYFLAKRSRFGDRNEDQNCSGCKPSQFLINQWHIHVSMYNIGSPRVGNGAFAAFYDRHVPDSFRIVVDGDMITSTPLAYTHVGTEIIIDGVDGSGSIIIDPSFVERLFRVRNKTSMAAHSTDIYQSGIRSVLEAASQDLRELLVKSDDNNGASARSLESIYNIDNLLARYDSFQAALKRRKSEVEVGSSSSKKHQEFMESKMAEESV